MKIFEVKFFDESILVNFGVYENSSFWIDSHFLEERIILQSDAPSFDFRLHSTDSSESTILEILEEQFHYQTLKF